jgi:hypothetical protein
LVGFLFRIAAFAGLLLNFTFFLSATWNAFPFYFGSDIVFAACWLTLLLTGPQAGQSIDNVLARRFHSLGWLVARPSQVIAVAAPTNATPNEVQVPLARKAVLYPKQVLEVNRAFDKIEQQFVSHRETQTIIEFVRAFVISLGVDRNDTPRLLHGLENLVNRSGGEGS